MSDNAPLDELQRRGACPSYVTMAPNLAARLLAAQDEQTEAPLPVEVTVRDGRVWSNVSVAETIVTLLHAADRLRGNAAPFAPQQRLKNELQA